MIAELYECPESIADMEIAFEQKAMQVISRIPARREAEKRVAEVPPVNRDFCHPYARTRTRLVLLGGKHSSAVGDARRQADALQSGKDRGEIMSLVGLDQPSRAQQATMPRSTSTENLSNAPGGAELLCLVSGSGDSSSVH